MRWIVRQKIANAEMDLIQKWIEFLRPARSQRVMPRAANPNPVCRTTRAAYKAKRADAYSEIENASGMKSKGVSMIRRHRLRRVGRSACWRRPLAEKRTLCITRGFTAM